MCEELEEFNSYTNQPFRLLSLKEVSIILGVSVDAVSRMTVDNTIPFCQVGHRKKIRNSAKEPSTAE